MKLDKYDLFNIFLGGVLFILVGVLIGLYLSKNNVESRVNQINKIYIANVKNLQDSIKSLTDEIHKLTGELKSYDNLKRLKSDLDKINNDRLKMKTLTLCYSESGLNYQVKHTSKYDKTTVGICGIKPEYWTNVIGNTNPNSLYAASLILEYLLDKYDNDYEKVLMIYKGAKNNTDSVKIALNYYNKIK